MRPSEILHAKRNEVRALAKSYEEKGLHDLRVFGSVARGEDEEGSDIDFVVTPEREKQPGFYVFALGGDLEDLLGVKVDVVTEDTCDEEFIDSIRREAVLI